MSEPLHVNPIDLHMSADHMSVHHTDLRTAHAAAASDIEAAQSGWVGASAAALQTKLAEWQGTTEQLCERIADHEQSFRAAGNAYQSADGDSAKSITSRVG